MYCYIVVDMPSTVRIHWPTFVTASHGVIWSARTLNSFQSSKC